MVVSRRMTEQPPEVLFVAHPEVNIEKLTSEGLSGPYGGELLLYPSLEEAEAAQAPYLIGCLIMIQAQRMADDRFEFQEVLPGVWLSPAVPPKYLWISERHIPEQ